MQDRSNRALFNSRIPQASRQSRLQRVNGAVADAKRFHYVRNKHRHEGNELHTLGYFVYMLDRRCRGTDGTRNNI